MIQKKMKKNSRRRIIKMRKSKISQLKKRSILKRMQLRRLLPLAKSLQSNLLLLLAMKVLLLALPRVNKDKKAYMKKKAISNIEVDIEVEVVIGETTEEIEATKSHSEVVEDGRTVLVPMQEVKDSTTKTNNTQKANKLKQLKMMRILTIIIK